ncbi:hypothetical protein MTR62_15970 [Novosphingobium sp. 1949]|uniref:DUF5672 domain-containing protein n=1 Tax=Novosphingobium organovorum TaxID=2930092 RepID=A0ABT0BGH7_9SPHN|nr:DUF5672 family protein [Novosphingobium organovorum]MCJ2184176.1 hypothetical protein [Novosphingobium organovorum]
MGSGPESGLANGTRAGTAARLALPQVTICAVSSVNVAATLRALEACLDQLEVAACRLLTDAAVTPAHPDIEVVPITPIRSSAAYSRFMLENLADHVATSHCLVVQWDGHVIDAARWDPAFLDYDYIGASWPQFADGRVVGNGGFSLRSKALLEACRGPHFCGHHPEDTAICRTNRAQLEARGLRFGPRELADRFAAERSGDPAATFGYHGVFLMPQVLGADAFWQVYRELDDRGTLRRDFGAILKAVRAGPDGARRAARMLGDRVLQRRKRRAVQTKRL